MTAEQQQEAVMPPHSQLEEVWSLSPYGIVFIDTEGTIQNCNPQLLRMFGYDTPPIGKNIISFVAKQDQARAIGDLKTSQLGDTLSTTYCATTLRGEHIDVQVFAHHTANGIIIHIEEITDEVAMRRRWEVLEQSPHVAFAIHSVILNDQKQVINYRYEYASLGWQLATGLENPTGKTVLEIIPNIEQDTVIGPNGERQTWIQAFGLVGTEGVEWHFQHYSETLGRTYAGVAFRTGENEFAVIFLDISQFILLEQATLDTIPESVVRMRAGGIDCTVNTTFTRILGYTQEALCTDGICTVVIESERAEFKEKIEALRKTGGEVCIEFTAARADGTTFDAQVIATATVEGDTIFAIRDISHIKAIHRAKDAFVSNVSHELRTPITNIKLRQHLAVRQPEKVKEHLEVMRREIVRLEKMIEDLLTLSRIDQGRTKITKKNVPLPQIIQLLVHDRGAVAEAKELSLRIASNEQSLPAAPIDESLITQAIGILIDNAIHYTEEGHIQVSVGIQTRSETSSQYFVLHITDTGIGIPIEEQGDIFKRFSRGNHALKNHLKGTGLGLAIAKEIVELHDGFITVESTGIPGEGSTFSIWLPLEE